MDYRFLSGFDTSYSKSVRAHVLRRHLQERRLRAGKRKATKDKAEDEDDQSLLSRDVQHDGRSDTVGLHSASGTHEPRPDASSACSLVPYADPQSLLGQGAIDPFFDFGYRLSDNCGDILLPYGVLKGSRNVHPPRDICMNLNLSDEACMRAVFTYTAEAISKRGGGSKWSMVAMRHRVAAIQLIKERLEQQGALPDDGTIQAVIGLVSSMIENRLFHMSANEVQEMERHVQGLRAMVSARGGISPSLYAPSIYWLLHWVDLSHNGNVFPSSPMKLRDLNTTDCSHFSTDASYFVSQGHAEDFVEAYRNFYYAAKARSLAILPADIPENIEPQVSAWLLLLIQQGSILYRRLYSSTSSDLMKTIVPLIYLNIIFWHYQHSDDNRRSGPGRFAQIHRMIRQARVANSVTAMWWILVTDLNSHRIHHPHAAWLLNRLLRIESQLSIQLQERFKATMVQFLLTDEIEIFEPLWLTPEQFRQAVMTDLNFEQ